MSDSTCPSGCNLKEALVAAVIIGGFFYVGGQYLASLAAQKGVDANRELSVQGTGKISQKPDIATITVGVQTGAQSSTSEAMRILTQKFNAVAAAVKKEDIADKDITTVNLATNPVYDYLEGKQTARGFEAAESVVIKIRNLDKIGSVVASATAAGANQVGGVEFTFDSPEQTQLQAQQAAIKDAQAKAEALAKDLDVKLGSVKTYSTQYNQPIPMYAKTMDAVGLEGPAAPEVPVGNSDVTATVSITYQIR